MPNVYLGNMTRLPALIKIAEIIFLIISISIAQAGDVGYGPPKTTAGHNLALGYGIVIGYLIVYLILIVCYLIGETGTQHSKFELLLNAVGAILFLSLAIFIFVRMGDFRSNKYKTRNIVNGVFLLFVSCCQILDAVFIIRRGNE